MNLLGRARPLTIDAVVRDLASTDVQVRAETAQLAAHVVGDAAPGDGRRRVIDALCRTLTDPHPGVRGAAALALADLEALEALEALLAATGDDEPSVRALAATALGELAATGRSLGPSEPGVRERLRRALSDEAPEVRFQAIVAYPRLIAPDESTTVWSVLANGLADEDAQVRARAAEACAELANGATLPRDAADRLARLAVASDEPHDVRVAAAIALGESRDARCAPVLLDCLAGTIDEPDPRRVQAIFELVGELGLAAARPLLTQAAFGWRARLGDPSRRAAALGALVRLGERRAVEHVLAELGARSWERRLTALGVVTRTRLTEARGHVAALASHPMTSDAAAAALAALDVPKDA